MPCSHPHGQWDAPLPPTFNQQSSGAQARGKVGFKGCRMPAPLVGKVSAHESKALAPQRWTGLPPIPSTPQP